ncbi:MAG: hypothetical protein GY950_10230, partial [bacterium]|nr:hypothetical protein [bacterium]
MIKDKRGPILKALIAILFCVLLSGKIYAYIYHNGSGGGYDPPDGGEKTNSNINTIEVYVE